MQASSTVEPPAARALLLARARVFFRGFLSLSIVVQVLELVDATTALWPHRGAALLGIVVLAVWGVHVGRSEHASALGDVAVAVAIALIGLGLGRSGAVLVSLIAVLPLRALHGDRRDVTAAAFGVYAAYGLVTVVNDGVGRLFDLGFVVVVGAASAFLLSLRRLGELLAQHDLRVRLDEVATTVAARLVATTTVAEVDQVEVSAEAELRAAVADAPAVRAGQEVATTVRRRIDGDLGLARQRIATEARYRTVAEGSRDGLYLRAPGDSAMFSYLNPAAEAMLGVGLADLVADPALGRALLDDDDRRGLNAAVADGRVVTGPVEVRLRRPDGEERWIAVQERLVDVGSGRSTVLGTLHDVTARHEEAEALRRVADRERAAAAELRHLDEMKSMFLQAVSHELRTPLSAVIGAAQTLDARHADLAADQRGRLLGVVQRQSARLERLLTDLLDVDRLSRGLVTPVLAPTDLLELAAGVAASIEDGAAADRIAVTGDALVVPVDAPKVERIVDNLLRNALRHTPAGTGIVCRVSRDGDDALLVVEDEGPGVPDALKTELFEPFSQGPTAHAAASPGTGIGLALVRALADLHGGAASIEDRPGGGARFVVRLPAGARAPATAAPNLPGPDPTAAPPGGAADPDTQAPAPTA